MVAATLQFSQGSHFLGGLETPEPHVAVSEEASGTWLLVAARRSPLGAVQGPGKRPLCLEQEVVRGRGKLPLGMVPAQNDGELSGTYK